MAMHVELSRQDDLISDYHEEIEKFFKNKRIKISTLPNDLDQEFSLDYSPIEIGSAQQYRNYLWQQIAFWEKNDPNNNLDIFSHVSSLRLALSAFDNAVKHSKNNNPGSLTNMRNALNSSTQIISSNGSLYSELQLTRFILTLKNKSPDFLSGVRLYFKKNRNSNNAPSKLDAWNGYYAAMEYSKVLEPYQNEAKRVLREFKGNIELANANYAALNEHYAWAFREQQEKLQEIQDQTGARFSDFEESKNSFFDSAQNRIDELEYLYGEKLRLSKPAEYWEVLENEYRQKGNKWLTWSCILSALIVGGLASMIIFVPQLFSKDVYWIENVKNSIVLTVITSLAIYMLRLCVKMSTTSYHLSRDAKERGNLSYFYLALIKQGAVTDKERALILNALFSRSDTGLLKGDAVPSMPSNISDLVSIIDKVSDAK